MKPGSFLRDLEQVKHVFSPRIPNTLIILDEFGRGTSHLDGTSLLAATINNFSMCEDSDIMALISTHMFEIFEPSILFESTQNNIEHLTMDVLIPEDDKDENPIFLYKYVAITSMQIPISQETGLKRVELQVV